MVTFTTVKTRIAAEMNRADIASGGANEARLTEAYQDAVEQYANEKFWFNSIRVSVNTAALTQTVTVPSTVQTVERLTLPAARKELTETTMGDLDDGDGTGSPDFYAYYNDTLYLFPTPDAIYALRIYGIAKIAAPSSGSDDNIWTNEAAPLLRANAKKRLYRGFYRDTEGALLAQDEEREALAALRRETARRLTTALRMPSDTPWSRDRYDWSFN